LVWFGLVWFGLVVSERAFFMSYTVIDSCRVAELGKSSRTFENKNNFFKEQKKREKKKNLLGFIFLQQYNNKLTKKKCQESTEHQLELI
jgi:hypothetical protein